jgi:NAD-dependent deacetylase
VLAELEAAGIIKTLITQNIDGLHQRAGSRTVIELHGDTRTAACIRCYAVYAAAGFVEEAIDRGEIPHCPACGGILKPDVILYGEALPVQALMAAKRAVLACDLMLVAGSSLEVAPASDLPIMAIKRQVALVLINQGQTYLDQQSDVVLHADVAEALPQIAALCRNYT